MSTLTIPAYAKINLALYVLGKRSDGYHDIATLLQAIDLKDTLTLDPDADQLDLTCSDPRLPTDDSNLVCKAVRALEQRASRPLPVRIDLTKEIPVGAGLGGGSSDAAATLWGMNQLFDLGLNVAEMQEIGAGIGSDVPFFRTSGQALAEGRGERLQEFSWPVDFEVVIAFPGIPISAREGYSRVRPRLTNPIPSGSFNRYLAPGRFWAWIRSQENDLAAGVCAAYPVVSSGVKAMRTLGATLAGVTGSGSAVFGLFPRSTFADVRTRWPAEGSWLIRIARPIRSDDLPLPAS